MQYIKILKAMKRAMVKVMSDCLTIEEKSSSINYLIYCTEYNTETLEKLARTFLDRPKKRARVLKMVENEIEDFS
jgi:UDP-N-acetylglucosamine 2-epimerase